MSQCNTVGSTIRRALLVPSLPLLAAAVRASPDCGAVMSVKTVQGGSSRSPHLELDYCASLPVPLRLVGIVDPIVTKEQFIFLRRIRSLGGTLNARLEYASNSIPLELREHPW